MNIIEQSQELVWPTLMTVEVGPDVDFVYIMRKDGDFTMSPVASAIASDYDLDQGHVKSLLLGKYDEFFAKLADHLCWAFSSKGHVELHVFDPVSLEECERQKAGILSIVSLDPLLFRGVFDLKVSRGFWLGGTKDHGQVNRPGSPLLSQQADEIKAQVGDVPVCVVEDDIFSGGSVIRAVTSLTNAGVKIQKLIAGIQVGEPTKLSEMGIIVDPVVIYKTTDGTDIFDKVDLGDPRDYLLGASGLVEKLPDGSYGRAPYILPFVSTAARASIPKSVECEFAQRVLIDSIKFFGDVEDALGKPVLLKHMDAHFGRFLHTVFNIDKHVSMKSLSNWFLEHLDTLGEANKKLGAIHKELDTLMLPVNLVFVDLDGTIIPDDAQDGAIDPIALVAFQSAVKKLQSQGIVVGLNSDSPLPELIGFADKLGIVNAPIIAENGNIVAYNGRTFIVAALGDREGFIEMIRMYAAAHGYVQEQDCVNSTFGGEPVNYMENKWAFGANRETSVSVFGSSELIAGLGRALNHSQGEVSVDCSPEYHYFALHPANYRKNKGNTLSLLAQFGHNVIMIGNSMSDWLSPESGVLCGFVGNACLPEVIQTQAAFVAKNPLLEGVVEILSQISGGEPYE